MGNIQCGGKRKNSRELIEMLGRENSNNMMTKFHDKTFMVMVYD